MIIHKLGGGIQICTVSYTHIFVHVLSRVNIWEESVQHVILTAQKVTRLPHMISRFE